MLNLLIAAAGTALCAYHDQYNNKLVPARLTWGFMAVAFLYAAADSLINITFPFNAIWGMVILVVFEGMRVTFEHFGLRMFGKADSIIWAALACLVNPVAWLTIFMVSCASLTYFAVLAAKKPDLREILLNTHPFIPHILVGVLVAILVST